MKNITLSIDTADKKSRISPEIYGHFSEHLGRCIYNGIFVGEDSTIPNKNGVRTDIIDALKNIKIPVLRWPGGCFADEYHWKDGIGEKQHRKKMINTNWGHVTEDNSFGTNEFMNLCEELGCEPYVSGNLGSGTVQELAEWVEYMTFDGASPLTELRKNSGREKPWKLKYLGIGNESWGCGGNMTAEYYAGEYRKYQTFCKDFSGNKLFKIACGPSGDDYEWTHKLMQSVKPQMMNAISLHYYTLPTGEWDHKGSATVFDDVEYYDTIYRTIYMEELLTKHSEIMDRYDPDNKVGLVVDEWGCWYDVEEDTNPGFLYQQNTMRDAVVAAFNLNIFNSHSDRVIMANIAQTVNVLQAVILTEGEKMILTPTYHVFDLFKEHQGAMLIGSRIQNFIAGRENKFFGALSCSASLDSEGNITITVSNASLEEIAEISCNTGEFRAARAEGRLLCSTAPNAHNTFDNPERVKPVPLNVTINENGTPCFRLPACSVASVKLYK